MSINKQIVCWWLFLAQCLQKKGQGCLTVQSCKAEQHEAGCHAAWEGLAGVSAPNSRCDYDYLFDPTSKLGYVGMRVIVYKYTGSAGVAMFCNPAANTGIS